MERTHSPLATHPLYTLITDVNLDNLSIVTKIRQTRSANDVLPGSVVKDAKRHGYARSRTAWQGCDRIMLESAPSEKLRRLSEQRRNDKQPPTKTTAQRNVSFFEFTHDGEIANSVHGSSRCGTASGDPPPTSDTDVSALAAISYTHQGGIFVPSDKYSRRRERTRSPFLGANRGYTLLKPVKGILMTDSWHKHKNFNVNWLTPPQTAPGGGKPQTAEKRVQIPHKRHQKAACSVTWAVPSHSRRASNTPNTLSRSRPVTVGLKSYGPDHTKWSVPEVTKFEGISNDWMRKLDYVKRNVVR